jgi:hypothetical protein
MMGAAAPGYGQTQPAETKPAPKPVSEKKPAAEPKEKIAHGYTIHQSLEVGGRLTKNYGSSAMWDTLVNQGTGGRILAQSLELRTVNPSKTPFFDTLTTSSFGYGGDANNVSRLNISKGRLYDFAGSFRRDRQYFDYNLLDNSLLGPNSLVPEPDSPHLFNTVRRNTDTNLTILPLSFVSFRAGYNHGIHEGPSYSSVHEGGDAQLYQWFQNSNDTYTGGADVKLAKRTTLSYDQFYVHYKGDTRASLAGAIYQLSDGTPVSLGLDTLSTATCGSGANKGPEVVNGIANSYCSGFLAMNITAPTRTNFPTEQLRFSSHYWDRASFVGRFLYSGATGGVYNFNETFNGLTTRTGERQEIDTGGMANGQLATAKRVNVNGDFGVIGELNKYISISDDINYWDFRVPGTNNVNAAVYTDANKPPSLLDPLSAITPVTTNTVTSNYLNQKITQNTLLGTVSVTSQLKLSGGWRFKSREVADSGPDDLTWHENWVLLGAVVQPSPIVRLNLNYDGMTSKAANTATTSNTFTRAAPDKIYHFRARATVKPAKWINFNVATNDFSGKNDDPLVNHVEHNRDFSFAASIIPVETISFDLDFARDSVFSQTDICYVATPAPTGATNSGACAAAISGSASYINGTAYYDVPATFFAGSFGYAPSRVFKFNGGARVNAVNGTAEMLNPFMIPGALQSTYVTPFSDVQVHIAQQWDWHANWVHNGYHENGAQGATLASRNTHGDTLTLSVKYAF